MIGNISPEMEKIIAEAEANEFDVDKALNTKGFAEFLATHPDAKGFDMGNEGDVQKRFETFEVKGLVAKELRELYSGHIENEMGIKLDTQDQSSIDKHIEKMAIENPDSVLEMREKLETFKKMPEELNKLEAELAQLGKVDELTTKIGALQKDKANLEIAKDTIGFIGNTKLTIKTLTFYAKATPMLLELLPKVKFSDAYAEDVSKRAGEISKQWDARDAVKNKFGKLKKERAGEILVDVDNQLLLTEQTLSKVQDVQKLKSLAEDVFLDLRKELLGGVSDVAELTVAIQKKVNAQFLAMTRTGTIKSFDQMQERFESLRSVADTTETGVDPLGAIDLSELQKRVDAALEKAASEEIMQTVLRANMGTNALMKLEKALEPFLTREKIGSKEGDEAREFISETLEEVAANLGATTEDKAKKLMIARILIKMKS